MKDFIQLNKNDNVVISLRNFEKGEKIKYLKNYITIKRKIGFGHKVAIKSIKKGDKILKYGLSIGSATKSIEIGEHVHIQNLRPDYVSKQI